MSLFDAARYRLRTFFRRGTADRARDEEFAFHRDQAALEHEREGLTAEAARRAARLEFGNATYVREQVRWTGGTRWVDPLAQDVRHAWRMLRRSPLFALVAVLSLALGIGANALIFGMVHSLLLARLAVTKPDELRLVTHATESPTRAFFNDAEVAALREARPGEVAALYRGTALNAEAGGVTMSGLSFDGVDGAFFRVAGVGLATGRAINESDDQAANPVAVVSHAFAEVRFGSTAGAIGKPLRLDGTSFVIVGVSAAGYEGLSPGVEYSLAIPASMLNVLQQRPQGAPRPDVFLVTRQGPNFLATREALTAAYASCCARGDAPTAGSRDARIGFLDISQGIHEGNKIDVRAQYRSTLYALLGGVAVLLLIGCMNVSNLVMARATVRARELAVRLSLGASRARIGGQLLVESGLLVVLGAVAGLLLALWGSAALSRNLPAGVGVLSPFVAIRPGVPIVAFTIAVAFACVLIVGVMPAIRATQANIVAGLRDGQTGSRHMRTLDRVIVALEVGLALLLVTSAGLLAATLRHLTDSVGGRHPETLMVIQLDSRGTPHSSAELQAKTPSLQAQFAALPGVQRVAASHVVPLIYGGLPMASLNLPGLEASQAEEVEVAEFAVASGYFETLGIRLIAGRDFTDRDVLGAPRVAVISENVARQFFAGRNPVGETFGFRGEPRDIQVIGVVEDAKQVDLRAPAPRTVYLAYGQSTSRGERAVWAVRTSVDPAKVVPAARAAIVAELPNIRIRHVHPVTELLSITIGKERALTTLAIAFGILALLLAAVGIYGVTAFYVSARTREIGVRMALGASRAQVIRMVLGQGLVLVLAGLLMGVPLALAAARSLGALLYGVTPFDPLTLTLGALILAVAGMTASLIPSANAAKVDPLIAIRAE
jgi:predicted permease